MKKALKTLGVLCGLGMTPFVVSAEELIEVDYCQETIWGEIQPHQEFLPDSEDPYEALKVWNAEAEQYYDVTLVASIELTKDERYWLEKLVEAEAADEPFNGKLAVATTIANRYEDEDFPNTVMGVITQKRSDGKTSQYSPWDNGSIYERVASEESVEAVSQVFDDGIRSIPADTMYFHDPRYSPNNWQSRTREYLFEIENHVFTSKYAKESR